MDQLGTRLMQIWRRMAAAECFPYLTRWLVLAACFHAMPRLPSHNKCLLQRWLPLLLTTILDGLCCNSMQAGQPATMAVGAVKVYNDTSMAN
ncbi:uncharacterized protein LOC110905322 isoform X1 [Helianthus annuus]|uniref:uncharacterized protein LOC110905322 isoform X1 n=1 Tax=Helianthus annuus TaxID=4232 RepID=UPI001652CD4B|nr:uncharacterized protein LOC110905322 isoform X1 [Helianthus annuus]